MKKLLLPIIVLLLTIQVAYAIGIDPAISINAEPTSATTFSTIVATAVDAMDNAGIDWIKIYRDGSLLEEKDCEGKSLCTFIKVDYERNAVNHNYYAKTKDIDGNEKTSSTINTLSRFSMFFPINVCFCKSALVDSPYSFISFLSKAKTIFLPLEERARDVEARDHDNKRQYYEHHLLFHRERGHEVPVKVHPALGIIAVAIRDLITIGINRF